MNETTNLADTWTWDGATWTQQAPAASPPARARAGSAPSLGGWAVALFGGVSAQGRLLGDTWLWTGTTWLPLHLGAAARAGGAAAAYDPLTRSVVVFSGMAGLMPTGDAGALH